MSRFNEEIRIIPRPARLIAVLVYIIAGGGLAYLIGRDVNPPPVWGRVLFGIFLPWPLVVYTLLIGYVYADSKRRAMRHVLWTLLATFVPNGIGIILYFLMREPMLVKCTNCGGLVRQGFAFCPHCGVGLARSCPQCRRGVEPNWTHCAYCGATL